MRLHTSATYPRSTRSIPLDLVRSPCLCGSCLPFVVPACWAAQGFDRTALHGLPERRRPPRRQRHDSRPSRIQFLQWICGLPEAQRSPTGGGRRRQDRDANSGSELAEVSDVFPPLPEFAHQQGDAKMDVKAFDSPRRVIDALFVVYGAAQTDSYKKLRHRVRPHDHRRVRHPGQSPAIRCSCSRNVDAGQRVHYTAVQAEGEGRSCVRRS